MSTPRRSLSWPKTLPVGIFGAAQLGAGRRTPPSRRPPRSPRRSGSSRSRRPAAPRAARARRAAARGVGEHPADRRGEPRDVAGRERHAGLAVDHHLAEPARRRRHQRRPGRRRLQRDDPERLVAAGQHHRVGRRERWRPARRRAGGRGTSRCAARGAPARSRRASAAAEPVPATASRVPGCARRIRGSAAMRSWIPFSYSSRPKENSSGVPRRRRRARSRAPAGRATPAASIPLCATVIPAGSTSNSSATSARIAAEQVITRVGPVGQPPLHRVHLARQRRRQPAREAAGLGGVERGHERHVERVGQRDGRVGDQPVVGVHDVGPPRRRAG